MIKKIMLIILAISNMLQASEYISEVNAQDIIKTEFNECPICRETEEIINLDNLCKVHCQAINSKPHIFHRNCILPHIDNLTTCPMCNTQLTKITNTFLLNVINGNIDKVEKELLEQKINVNNIYKEADNATALHLAVKYNQERMVPLLLRYAAKISIHTLCLACRNGNENIIDILLQNSNIINKKDALRTSPLGYACMSGNLNIVKLLISHGADIRVKSRGYHITGDDHSEWFKYYNGESCDIFQLACRFGRYDIVEFLIDKDFDIDHIERSIEEDISDYTSSNAIAVACARGYTRIVKLLIEHNVDLGFKDYEDNTLLMIACKYRYLDIVKLLLKTSSIDIDHKNDNGYTALNLATSICEVDIIKLLLDYMAPIRNSDIMLALSKNYNAEILNLFITHGTHIRLTDKAKALSYKFKLKLDRLGENYVFAMAHVIRYVLANYTNADTQGLDALIEGRLQ